MTATSTVKSPAADPTIDGRSVFARVLDEGYGPGAWHGADMKAALADVTPAIAFRRPAPGRHSIAEIALHHAFYVRVVTGRLAGVDPEPFPLEGEDWFPISGERDMSWAAIAKLLEQYQGKLAAVVADISSGRISSPLTAAERFDNVLGITGHAIYHAGQVQLVKALLATSA
jgi:hypothetical protein